MPKNIPPPTNNCLPANSKKPNFNYVLAKKDEYTKNREELKELINGIRLTNVINRVKFRK